jgi:hypothetical protein
VLDLPVRTPQSVQASGMMRAQAPPRIRIAALAAPGEPPVQYRQPVANGASWHKQAAHTYPRSYTLMTH